MKRTLLLTLFVLCSVVYAGHAQKLAVKVNGLGLGTFAGAGQWSPTPNLGVEAALWPRLTVDIDGYLNPFTYSDNKGTQFWAVQPELRFWLCNKFNGHFLGLHGQYAEYDKFGAKTYLYDGNFWGVGLSYGYVLPLAERWKLEFNLGVGYNKISRDNIWGRTCIQSNPEDAARHESMMPYGEKYGHLDAADKNHGGWIANNKNYWGITRAGISVIFIIR
jgi:hypothetical protein